MPEEQAGGFAWDSRPVCATDAVKCGYSKTLHLVLFVYSFKTHTQSQQVEQYEPIGTFPPAAPLLLIFLVQISARTG